MYRQWVRDYGVTKANGIAFATARVNTAKLLVRFIMWATQTRFAHADIWDDFLHDNLPPSWENGDEPLFGGMTDHEYNIAHELLIMFVRDDLSEDPTEDIVPNNV